MSLLFVPRAGDPSDPVVLYAHNFQTEGITGTIHSGLRFGSDGKCYARQPSGGWTSAFTWLFDGLASDYYVSRSIDAGSLTTDAGAGPLQMNADRDYDVQISMDGEVQASVTFSISNDVSGSPVVVSRSYVFFAERGFL